MQITKEIFGALAVEKQILHYVQDDNICGRINGLLQSPLLWAQM
jgi:hypothetical protein